MRRRDELDVDPVRFARMREWTTLTDAARTWGISRQAAHDRVVARRIRRERSGAHRTAPLRLAACCVEAEAACDPCDCRSVLDAVEMRRAR